MEPTKKNGDVKERGMSLRKYFYNLERRMRDYYNVDPRIPENERRARIYMNWFDHGILRVFWTNFHEIAPGAFRSNNPTRERFEKMRDMGIQTVVNLRGVSNSAHYLTELQICEDLGLTLIDRPLKARHTAKRENILELIETFRTLERPFVMHCKSGADRAGFASAIYLMVMCDTPVQEARRMLSVKYVHLKFTKTGILDYLLRTYQARNARDAISFENWIAAEYNDQDIQTAFDQKKAIEA